MLFSQPKNLLIIPSMRLSGLMLTLPALAMIKNHLPDTKLTILADPDHAPLCKMCVHIDEVIASPFKQIKWWQVKELTDKLKAARFDASLSFYSTFWLGWALLRCGIKNRFAAKTKIAQIWHNHLLLQRRSQSIQPEWRYNLDLAKFFLLSHNNEGLSQRFEEFSKSQLSLTNEDHYNALKEGLFYTPTPPFLHIDENDCAHFEKLTRQKYNIKKEQKIVLLHPATQGTCPPLPPQWCADVLNELFGLGFFILISNYGDKERCQK